VTCNKRWFGSGWLQDGPCPDHDGFAPYRSMFECERLDAMCQVDDLAFGCLDGTDFDQIGKVLMDGLEAWMAEADRRANIENKGE
jgi:hypothetical protein